MKEIRRRDKRYKGNIVEYDAKGLGTFGERLGHTLTADFTLRYQVRRVELRLHKQVYTPFDTQLPCATAHFGQPILLY